jgi:hypothetical protein
MAGQPPARYKPELELGVPDSAVLLEPRATNTGENIEFTKAVLKEAGTKVSSVLLQRVVIFPDRGLAIAQEVPDDVAEGYARLCQEGFSSRLLPADMTPPPGR